MLIDLIYSIIRFDKFKSVEEVCYTESIRDKYNLIADLLLVTTDDLIVAPNNNTFMIEYIIEKFKSGELISHIKENDFVNDEEDYIKDIKIYKYKSEKLAIINNGELLVLQNLSK